MSDFTKEDNELIQREFEQLRLAALKRCASQEEYEGGKEGRTRGREQGHGLNVVFGSV